MYIYTPLCRYWIALYRYVLVFIVPHVDIELEDNKQFISNIPRISKCGFFGHTENINNPNTVAITFFLSVYAFGVRFKIVA